MDFLDALILGIVQGITEFLPISSSGHLVIFEEWLGLPTEDLMGFDVAVHFGTLIAILVYFWRDFVGVLKGVWSFLPGVSGATKLREERQMVGMLIIGTLPAVVVGLFFKDYLEDHFRDTGRVAVMLMLVGLYFVFAEFVAAQRRKKGVEMRGEMGYGMAAIIGIAQSVALIPGVSRSGTTISTGLAIGMERARAARFSFLLGAVAIAAATLLSLIELIQGDLFLPGVGVLSVGIVSSFAAGMASMHFLMRFLKRHTLIGFSIYLLLMSLYLLFSLQTM